MRACLFGELWYVLGGGMSCNVMEFLFGIREEDWLGVGALMRQPHLTSPNTSISELSEDIIRQIFLFLRGCDLAKYAPLVCTEWARICRDDTLWRTRYELEFGFCKLDTYHAGWMERCVGLGAVPRLPCMYVVGNHL